MNIATRQGSTTVVRHPVQGVAGGGSIAAVVKFEDSTLDVRLTDPTGILQAGRVAFELKGGCLSALVWSEDAPHSEEPEQVIVLCANVHAFQKESAAWLKEQGV